MKTRNPIQDLQERPLQERNLEKAWRPRLTSTQLRERQTLGNKKMIDLGRVQRIARKIFLSL